MMIGFFDHVTPRSLDRTIATLAPRIFDLWFAKRMNPSTSVRSGRTLMMLPIVPAWVPGLKRTRGGSQLAPPFVVREKNACWTYDAAWKRPWSDGGKPGGDTKRSQAA